MLCCVGRVAPAQHNTTSIKTTPLPPRPTLPTPPHPLLPYSHTRPHVVNSPWAAVHRDTLAFSRSHHTNPPRPESRPLTLTPLLRLVFHRHQNPTPAAHCAPSP